MLRTHLKMNFVFGTDTDEYKGRSVLVYLQEGTNHEKQLLQGVLKNIEKQFLQGVLNESC